VGPSLELLLCALALGSAVVAIVTRRRDHVLTPMN
jgi:hypothetical protein